MVLLPSEKFALIVEYDGGQYHGFQVQAKDRSIQGEIEQALTKATGKGTRIIGAGRTDAGVHAKGQVVSFKASLNISLETLIRALNHYLPDDITVKYGGAVGKGFSARRSAISREYRYTILNSTRPSPLVRNYAHFIPTPLDVSAMNKACQSIIGRRDFASFTAPLEESTIRTVAKAQVSKEGESVFFDIVANSFLPKQVRCIIGSLIKVGLGKLSISKFQEIVQTKRPGLATPVAPAHGLCLVKVNYPEYEFSRGID